ncbi:hypothetical protein WOLCODRAFT_135922 [Wolfiporia cocos MD-104 SS10]|uniref:CDP-diacylglycerol--glycerol-3-phosphate 3-phosphatidyltransferase n=1 Tax=Wolfiporia cocos (strain MD-104) TaxID=742152 RepID=A0A2H3J8G4_WOLCO|nr:hypothetical protein WOLCODRAFT_135922 [Wolfiporia cocos MD-104 SS10]
MHLDYNRCTRPEALSTANMLLPLLREFPERAHVWLFRSPNLKGLMAKLMPPRFNEGWGGTWHPKIYGADDEILISGANLNTSYFTNRQDRYIHFAAQPALAQYCFSFLEQASVFSYELLPAPSPSEGYILHWSDERTHPHHTEQKAENALKSFQRARLAESRTTLSSAPAGEPDPATGSDSDVLIFPIVQAGQFHIREEEECLDKLFRYISPPEASPVDTPLVDLTSGYFGLYKPYQEQLIKANIAARVLAASPKANGFYASKGVSGRIPEGYTVLERRFMKALRAAGREWPHDTRTTSTGVQLSEWERDGWTYHAKGIWVRPTQVEDPVLTLFGSTNLNSRSANLDTELSFMLVTTSPVLRARLAQEVDGLRAHALPWQGDKRTVRPVSWLLASALCDRL